MLCVCIVRRAHIECYSDCSRRGSHLVELLCYSVIYLVCVVPSLYSVELCTCVACVCLVCLLLCREEGSSSVSVQLLRGRIWAFMRCPCLLNLFKKFLNAMLVNL